MITFDLMLKLLPVFILVVAITEFLRRMNNKLDEVIALQWRTMELLERALGQKGSANAFDSRSGHVIRRR